MKSKGIALGLCILTVLAMVIMPLKLISGVYAQDVVNLTFKKKDNQLIIDADGTLSDSWYYKQIAVPVAYDDGKTAEIHLVIDANGNTIKSQYNWGSQSNGKMISRDETKRAFSGEVAMPLSSFADSSFTVTYNNQKTKIEATDEKKNQAEQNKETKSDQTNDDSNEKTKTLTSNVDGKIMVDGKLSDWSDQINSRTSKDNYIKYWKVVRDTAGHLYFCFTGTASTQWDQNYLWKVLDITQNGQKKSIQINNLANTTNGDVKMVNNANGNTSADYVVEAKIPASYLTDSDFTVDFASTSVKAEDIQVENGKDTTKKDDGVYHGIVIDGSFDDWNHVTKHQASCPNPQHPHCISQAAMMFDGDYVYIYVKDGKGDTAAHAGSHSNGNFAVTTDLGYTKMLHFNDNGTVTSSEIKNIRSRHVGDQWEVSFPKSQLPYYKKTISFGLYRADDSDLSEPFVKNVANIKSDSGNVPEFNGIIYDGNYHDWDSYPHTIIEYATAGTQEERADGQAAIYYQDGKVFGHVFTEMKAHLAERGGELAQAISIRINRDDQEVFYPRLISVDAAGNINWNPSFNKDGTFEYYLVDTQGWGSARTLAELKDGNHGNDVYGKMTMTIRNGLKDECEYYLDASKLAKKFKLDEKEMTYVEEKFGRIGQQWIGTTGASTNPWLGVAICIGITATVLIYAKYKKSH